MNNKKDQLLPDLSLTIGVILFIVALIFGYRSGNVLLPLLVYIILSVVLIFVNAMTYLPLITIAFIILKLTGRLLLGWQWIIVVIIIDILFDVAVPNIRNQWDV